MQLSRVFHVHDASSSVAPSNSVENSESVKTHENSIENNTQLVKSAGVLLSVIELKLVRGPGWYTSTSIEASSFFKSRKASSLSVTVAKRISAALKHKIHSLRLGF